MSEETKLDSKEEGIEVLHSEVVGVGKDDISGCENNASTNSDIQLVLKKVKKLELFNYVTIALLCIVIIFNFINLLEVPSNTKTNSANGNEILKVVDKSIANQTINNIKEYYNNGEDENLYNVLGEYAKTLISFEDFEKSMAQIEVLGNIINASYTHYTFLQNKEGANWFVLNYVAKYDNGDGNATVTIKVTGNEWEIVGFRFNIEQLDTTKN